MADFCGLWGRHDGTWQVEIIGDLVNNKPGDDFGIECLWSLLEGLGRF